MAMPRKRSWGCQRHCMIWWHSDGLLFIGCAHCSVTSTKINDPAGGSELLDKQVKSSHAGHKAICGKPIR